MGRIDVAARMPVTTMEAESPEKTLELPPDEWTGLVPPSPDER
jgi:hypothetical protein